VKGELVFHLLVPTATAAAAAVEATVKIKKTMLPF